MPEDITDILIEAKAASAEARAAHQFAESEIKRLDQLRNADQLAVTAALTAAKDAVAAALAASEKAVNKAEVAQMRVNETQNEFRGTLRDQATTLMPRSEVEIIVRELRGLIQASTEAIGILRSRIDLGPPELASLQTHADRDTGRSEGQLSTRTLVFSLIGLAIVVAGFLMTFSAFR